MLLTSAQFCYILKTDVAWDYEKVNRKVQGGQQSQTATNPWNQENMDRN